MEKRYYIGISKPTENVKQLRNIKESLIDNKIIDTDVPDDMISVAVDENLENLKPENIKLGVKIGNIEGNYEGEGIQFDIPVPTNLDIIDGVLVFDPVDISEYAEFNPTISYIIVVNDIIEIVTSKTNYSLLEHLNDGENKIEVQVRVQFNFKKDSSKNTVLTQYSKPSVYIYTLTATLPYTQNTKKTNAVEFGGGIWVFFLGTVYKFNPLTKTFNTKTYSISNGSGGIIQSANNKLYVITQYRTHKYNEQTDAFDDVGSNPDVFSEYLKGYNYASAVVGSNIYLFGGNSSVTQSEKFSSSATFYDTIYKFNAETEIGEKLSTVLPSKLAASSAAVVGSNIYLFGGYNTPNSYSIGTIYKFNAETETIETLTTIIPGITDGVGRNGTTAVSLGNNIYLFGGVSYRTTNAHLKDILKFNAETETIETLDLQLPFGLVNGGGAVLNGVIFLFNGGSYTSIHEVKIE